MFSEWGTAISDAWTNVWDRIVNFIPNLLGAIIILVVGWFVAIFLEKLIDQFLRIIGLQGLMERIKVENSIKKMGIKKDFSALVGATVKWIVYLVAFLGAADALNLPQISDFLSRVLNYVPSVVAASGILLIGVVLANFLENAVVSVVKGTEFGHAEFVGTVTKYAVLVFAFLAALVQLGVATILIQTLFTGFVALLAIAGGLAFGLGGQGVARDFLEKVRRDITQKK